MSSSDNTTPGSVPINDEHLSAWLDGELDTAEQARVQAWLDEHPEDRARVQAWASDRAALAAHFSAPLQEPVPLLLQRAVLNPATALPPRWALAAAAACLLLAGGVLGGAAVWQWKQQQHGAQLAQLRQQLAPGTAQGWVQRAAFAHSVYVGEPRHAVEVKAQEEHLSRWLTRRIDIPVKLFDLRDQGFELVGGRLLPDGPGKSAQLMYQDAQQRRVTVYLRKPEQGADAAFAYEQHGKLGMFYWVEEGAGYALVGEQPREVLLALARAIYQQHPGPMPAAAAPAPSAPAASAPR
jgi:anti-sigma factor RsiW